MAVDYDAKQQRCLLVALLVVGIFIVFGLIVGLSVGIIVANKNSATSSTGSSAVVGHGPPVVGHVGAPASHVGVAPAPLGGHGVPYQYPPPAFALSASTLQNRRSTSSTTTGSSAVVVLASTSPTVGHGAPAPVGHVGTPTSLGHVGVAPADGHGDQFNSPPASPLSASTLQNPRPTSTSSTGSSAVVGASASPTDGHGPPAVGHVGTPAPLGHVGVPAPLGHVGGAPTPLVMASPLGHGVPYQYRPPALPLSALTLQNLSTLPVFTLDDFHAAELVALASTRGASAFAQHTAFDKIKAGKLVGDAVISDVIPATGTRLGMHGVTSTSQVVRLGRDGSGWDGFPDYALSKLGGLRLWPGDHISFEGAWFEPR